MSSRYWSSYVCSSDLLQLRQAVEGSALQDNLRGHRRAPEIQARYLQYETTPSHAGTKHLTVHADHSVGAGQIRGAGANVPPISLARDASFSSAHAGRISHQSPAQDCNGRSKSASEGLLLALRCRDLHRKM